MMEKCEELRPKRSAVKKVLVRNENKIIIKNKLNFHCMNALQTCTGDDALFKSGLNIFLFVVLSSLFSLFKSCESF